MTEEEKARRENGIIVSEIETACRRYLDGLISIDEARELITVWVDVLNKRI